MADKREPVIIDLGDGVPRGLKLSISATKAIQKKFGSIEDMMKGQLVDVLPECIFASLIDKDGLTVEKIADIVDLIDVRPLFNKFLQAMTHVDVEAQIKAAEEKAALDAAEKAANPDPESEEKNEQTQTTATE